MTSSSNNKNNDSDEWVKWIEDGIANDYIDYHNYNEFQNIKWISSGGFGKIYQATWESYNNVVALKSFNNCIMKEIVNEVYRIILNC